MTSPISLLAMLGGTTADAATPAQPQAEDAALFAAALVSALQQLQPPARVVAPLTPVAVEGDLSEGDVPADAKGEATTLGELLGDAEAAASEGSTAAAKPTTQVAAPAASPGTTINVISDEPARPEMSWSRQQADCGKKSDQTDDSASNQASPPVRPSGDRMHPTAPLPQPAKAIDATQPGTAINPTPPAKTESAGAPEEPVQVLTTDMAAPLPVIGAPSCEKKVPDSNSGNDTPKAEASRGRTRSVNKGTVVVGDWSPAPAAFTGWKAAIDPTPRAVPKKDEQESTEGNSESQLQPPPVDPAAVTQVVAIQLPVAPPPLATRPTATDDQLPGEGTKSAAAVPAPVVDQAADLESSSDSVRQVQVANARLAAQLAQLVGDRNVTDFRVQLSKTRREPDATGEPAAKLPTDSSAPVVAQPLGKAPLVSKGERPLDQPVAVDPRPTKTETPIRVERQTVTSNRLLDLSDDPKIAAPLRAAREAAGPIVPVPRKEIPATSQSEKKSEVVQPERSRPRNDSASDSPVSASNPGPGRTESLTSRSSSSGPEENGEARNLPQEGPGNDRPAGSADRVTVQVSDSEGRQTRIRVSVLGDQVRAVIVPPDSESARQLEQRMDDLQTALARQGFASSKVSVQQAGENAVERNGASLATLASGAEGKAGSPGREQPAGDQRQGRGQREQQHPGDGHRHPNGRSRDQGAEHRRRNDDV